MFNREDYTFKYFFNAGIDRVTCQCDVEGTDVFDAEGNYIGSINWVTPAEIDGMDDEELEELMLNNDVNY